MMMTFRYNCTWTREAVTSPPPGKHVLHKRINPGSEIPGVASETRVTSTLQQRNNFIRFILPYMV
jgi:hypothetical protein